MQVRVDPCAGRILDVLRDGVRRIPFPTPIVPERTKGRRHGRRIVRGERRAEIGGRHTRVLVPTTRIAIPPAIAASPTTGDSGTSWCFSVVAWTGPMSSTFSCVV